MAHTAEEAGGADRTVAVDVPGWIRVYSDGTVERLTPPGGEALTADVPPYADPRGGVTVHDVATGRGVDVRLYLPEAAPNAAAGEPAPSQRPVLVHFHGGGFCRCRASWALYHNFYAPLAAELGAAGIVSVYLPLAPEHRLPAAVDAGHAALLWLRDVARGDHKHAHAGGQHPSAAAVERFRDAADFSRVFLIGDSAGGNLVHLVAARAAAGLDDDGSAGANPLHPVELAGGVLLHPGFAREQKSRSELENPPDTFLTPDMIDKLLALGLPLDATRDSPYTSPELAAEAVARVSMPPLLVMVAEKDLLHDPQVDYGKAMARHGKQVETVVSAGEVGHVFYLNFFAVQTDQLMAQRTKELIGSIKNFIDHH